MHIFQKGSQDSSVGIVTGYRLESWVSIPCTGKRFFSPQQQATGWTAGFQFHARARDFFSTASRLALGPTQSPVPSVPEDLSWG
jgi:hypothetical protein